VGRLLRGENIGAWVFGGICRETGDAFLVTVDRTSNTLFRAIFENIADGTRINSDKWAAYHTISGNVYTLVMVNHRFNFVDPIDPSINTQRIERMWRTLKSIILKQVFTKRGEPIWQNSFLNKEINGIQCLLVDEFN
jgi:hypothetical protein